MNCARIRELLPWYVGGDLRGEEEVAVWRHVASCALCGRQARGHQRAQRALTGLAHPAIPPRVLAGFNARVRRALRTAASPAPMEACERVRLRLDRLLDRELARAAEAEDRAHLAACAACREEWDALAHCRDALAELARPAIPPAVLAGFSARVRAGLEAAEPGVQAWPPAPVEAPRAAPEPASRRVWRALPAAAAVFAVFLLGGLLARARWGGASAPEPPRADRTAPAPILVERAAPAVPPHHAVRPVVHRPDRYVALDRAFDTIAGDQDGFRWYRTLVPAAPSEAGLFRVYQLTDDPGPRPVAAEGVRPTGAEFPAPPIRSDAAADGATDIVRF